MAKSKFSTVVIAIDFSPASKTVLARGLDLATRLGARAEVVSVTPKLQPALPFHRSNRATVAKLQQEEVQGARAALAERVADCDPPVRARLRIGVAHKEILAHAKEKGADLIVLGKRGQNLGESLLIGSTADRVLRKAPIPVVVVPTPPQRS